ncbi:heme-binding protein [Chlamydiia bacterium]|nr:heme-binding protein [Chlamydiia bacterium]
MKMRLTMVSGKLIFLLVLMVVSAIGITVASARNGSIEEPKYELLLKENNIEVRRYQPMIIAEIKVKSDRKKALNSGFRKLADFIFGKNTKNNDVNMTTPVQQQKEKIAMTAPVQQQKEKIAMTAPVQAQDNDENGEWSVSFVMPSEYTMETLPRPLNNDINIKEVKERTIVVIKFSGLNSEKNVKKHEKRLMKYIQTNSLKIKGNPIYAFYNPPWVPSFMRRNEILIEVID